MFNTRQNITRSLARLSPNHLCRGAFLLAAALVLSSALPAQTPAAADNPTPAPADNQNGGRGNRGNRGNMTPEEMQARMTANLKEQFGVASDDEWNLIMERITKVNELRTASGGRGGMGLRGFGGPGGQNGQGGRGNRQGRMGGGNPEVDALQTAINDKAPDAEVKARLERLREVRKENETKLAKAQEDLRAILSVRQEAAAVLAGLLP